MDGNENADNIMTMDTLLMLYDHIFISDSEKKKNAANRVLINEIQSFHSSRAGDFRRRNFDENFNHILLLFTENRRAIIIMKENMIF